MEIVYDDAQLRKYVDRALKEAQADTVVSGRLPSPLLIDKFLQDAVEIDVDALFDGEELYIGGIMEHVEEAGVHSGDAACTCRRARCPMTRSVVCVKAPTPLPRAVACRA